MNDGKWMIHFGDEDTISQRLKTLVDYYNEYKEDLRKQEKRLLADLIQMTVSRLKKGI